MKLEISSTGQLNLSTLCPAIVGDFFFFFWITLQSAHHIYCFTHLVRLIECTVWSGTMLDAGNSKTEGHMINISTFKFFPI